MPRDTLVGLDLGPSLPFVDAGAFFPGWSESPADARGLWALVERLCADDPHLAASSFVDHPKAARQDRKSVVWGKSVSGSVDLGGRRSRKKKTKKTKKQNK